MERLQQGCMLVCGKGRAASSVTVLIQNQTRQRRRPTASRRPAGPGCRRPLHQTAVSQVPSRSMRQTAAKRSSRMVAHLVVLPPGDLFVQQQADPAGAHIAQDGAVAHIGLQQVEGVGEIGRAGSAGR